MNFSGFFNIFKKYDFTFFGIAIVIFIIGIVNLYSATHASASSRLLNIYKMQIIFFIISFLAGMVISFIRPKNFIQYSWLVYIINILLLILVLILGDKGMGAQRWIVIGSIRFQPSEIMKISLVLILARWYSKKNADASLSFLNLAIPFLLTLLPACLIMNEPDLGTGILILLIFFTISFYRKMTWKSLAILALVGTVSSLVMFQFVLKPYQKNRVLTFLNPELDQKGAGYNAIQSKIAIGSGRFFGKGFKKSSQASLNYLPENHTDFVFSIFNEEHGFFGAIFLICLYLILLYRFVWLSTAVNQVFDSIVAIGLMSIFFWHVFVNMGMVMGLMPIVGLPLPLMSYGGSSLMTFGICCGIATSLSNSRNMF